MKKKIIKDTLMFSMQYDDFIKEYILPNEDRDTRLKYYQKILEFDKDYLLEIAKQNNIIIKDL